MRQSRPVFRLAAVALAVSAASGLAGCSWFKKTHELYAQSPEMRPLEVPPDLDLPRTDGAMALPPAPGSVTRSTMGAQAAGTAAAAANPTGFTVAGDRDALFARVGELLDATPGLTVVTRAQILGTYDVDYEGQKFLVRVVKVDSGAYISAIDPRGLPAEGEAPVKLIAALKAALGG
jgi:uncharacterized lipoprotein